MAKVNITQVRSRIGATKTQCKNLDALGLRRMGRTVQHEDSAIIMGMIERVRHLVKIETAVAEAKETAAKTGKVTAKAEKPAEVKAEKKAAAPKKEKAVAAVEETVAETAEKTNE